MVTLIIVSHSLMLAQGVCELAQQMAGDQVRIAGVGGLQNGDGTAALGTDVVRIAQAISENWSPQGVLLLVDMGSAVLSAELALDLLSAEQRAVCLISNAPLVEGAIVAAVEASLGGSLVHVNTAAEMAGQISKR